MKEKLNGEIFSENLNGRGVPIMIQVLQTNKSNLTEYIYSTI